ncbi:MAG: hypothetical protein KC442_10345 [Thermomicrobiales bacterium]|nr:hypothetical protein [Thermomicrobiales bacterium]
MSTPEPIRPAVDVIAKPALFTPWPDTVKQRAQDLWSTVAGRNASATQQLLQAEAPEASVPHAGTIRRWADDEQWHIAADHALESTRGRTVRELQAGWLEGLKLAQATLLAGMSGLFDDLPYGGSGRIKSAEITLRTLERAGMLASLPDPLPPDPSEIAKLSAKELSRQMRDHWSDSKQRDAEKPRR